MGVPIHKEPSDLASYPAESCVVCKKPTRMWADPHTPLCEDCAALTDTEPTKPVPPSPIKESACRLDGKVWTGKRHGNVIQQMMKEGCPRLPHAEQGFVTEAGEFLTRAEAYERAVQCGQIKEDGGTRTLVSEMLY